MTNEEETLKEFDEKFGKAGPERNSDSEGRIAGCDDCSSSVELRQEHRDFLIAKIKAQDKIAREEGYSEGYEIGFGDGSQEEHDLSAV